MWSRSYRQYLVSKNNNEKWEQQKLFIEKKKEQEEAKKNAETLKQMFKENKDFSEIIEKAFEGVIKK